MGKANRAATYALSVYNDSMELCSVTTFEGFRFGKEEAESVLTEISIAIGNEFGADRLEEIMERLGFEPIEEQA